MASNPAGCQPKGKDQPAATRPSLSGTIARLRKNNPSNPRKMQEALILIRKYFLKEKTGIDRLRHYGGIEALFEVIQGTNQTCTDIALSIVGNISMDTKVQNKILHIDGIKVLGKVIEAIDAPEIVNRAGRALGNLAQNPVLCCAIHKEEGVIADVVIHLTKTEDMNLQLTLIRALRLFADSCIHRQGVLNEEGLRAVSLHLKSEDERVTVAAYQCILVLSKEFSDVCARQIVAANAPAAVLEHTKHNSPQIKRAAFSIMMNTWINHHEMRVGIGNAGGIPFFISQINTLTEQCKRLIMANALCLSCCEVVNRVRVKDNGGLQMFLTMLQEPEYAPLHDRLISALTCFLYDESGWEILMKNGLVSVLIKHLKRVANLDELVKKHKTEDEKEDAGLRGILNQDRTTILCSKLKKYQEEGCTSSSVMSQAITENDGTMQTGSDIKPEQAKHDATSNSKVEKYLEEVARAGRNLDAEKKFFLESNIKVEVTTINKEEAEKGYGDKSVELTDENLSETFDNTSTGASTVKMMEDQLPLNIKTSNDSSLRESEQVLVKVTKEGLSEMGVAQETSMQSNIEPLATAAFAEVSRDDHGENKPKSNVIRYSLDSPTYKSVVDWTPDDYMSGPKNILESEHYQCGSPDRLSGYSSPSNYGFYSPLSVSSLDLSPDTSPRPRSVSPYLGAPEKRFSSSPESTTQSSSSCHLSSSPIWSPTHSTLEDAGSSSQFSVTSSPDTLSTFTTPLMLVGRSNDVFLDEALHYSSSDEDGDTNDFMDVSDGDEFDFETKEVSSLQVPGTMEGVSPSKSSVPEDVDNAKAADVASENYTLKTTDHHRLSIDSPDADRAGSSVKSKRTPLFDQSGTKRKRHVTPEMRKRILLSVEQSKSVPSPSIDLTKMMSASYIFNKKRELGIQKELPSDKRDHRRQIEYCLIMLIKKISCYADPSDDLITPSVFGTLLDYVSLAARTFSKCGRILVRLTKNTACFEAIILQMIPHLINDRLITKSTMGLLQKEYESKDKKATKPPEVINRSMSACSLSEATKAVQFHHEVKRQHKSSATKTKSVNRSEVTELKTALFSNLAFIAETPFGQGVIAHLLLTASTSDRIKTAVALSLICRSRSLQTKMYIHHHGFRYLIMAIKQTEDADLQCHTVYGLLTMASLRINKQFSIPFKSKTLTGREVEKPEAAVTNRAKHVGELFDVVFKMEDGSEVVACRATLMQHSEVFNAMLAGHYSESGQSEINMPGVSNAAFQIVVSHLHEELLSNSYDLDVVLEAHGLADRFILDNLMRSLCDLIVKSYLKMDTLQKIFAHAVLHEAYWVMRKCMNFLLMDPSVSHAERLSRFQDVLNSPHGDVAVDVIEDMFRS